MSRAANAARFQRIAEAQVDPHAAPTERSLLLAIVGQALTDATWPTASLSSGKSGTLAPSEDIRREAREWLASDSSEPYALCWIADHLGIDVSAMRMALADRIAAADGSGARRIFYGRRQRHTVAVYNEARALRAQGLTQRQVGERLGLPQRSVSRMVRRAATLRRCVDE